MRSRIPLFILGITLATLTLPHFVQAGIPYFGPIIPSGWNNCPVGWAGLIIVINNLISVALTLVITAVAPLTIGYAGYLYVINPVSPDGKSEARQMIMNVVIGLVLAFGSWLIVDAVLVALTGNGVDYWSLITSNAQNPCIQVAGSLNQANYTPGGTTGGGNPNQPLSSTGTGACDASLVQQYAAQGNYPIDNGKANTLACIAKYESSCGTAPVTNYNWGHGSSAAGAFQVTLQGNSTCYDNPVCEQAAGVRGPLNCAKAFSGGNPINGPLLNQCLAAAASIPCSAAAAACVILQQGATAWTADSHSSGQQQCISQYGG